METPEVARILGSLRGAFHRKKALPILGPTAVQDRVSDTIDLNEEARDAYYRGYGVGKKGGRT